MESSHETVSNGGDQRHQNVESSHETVSNGGVQRHKNVEMKLQDELYSSDEDKGDDEEDSDAEYLREDAVQKYKFDFVKSSVLLDQFPELDIERDKNPAAA